MNDPKKENFKNTKNESSDWEFSIDEGTSQIKVGDLDKSQKNKNYVDEYEKRKKQQNKKLTLSEPSIPKTKTRSAMALEVGEKQNQTLEDDFEKASLVKRFIAFVIDTAFLAGLIYLAKPISTMIRAIAQTYMDNYKLKFLYPDPITANIFLGVSILVLVFAFVVLPVSFYNASFGKKILGLKVRDIDTNTITLKQAFKRELIMKPLSLLVVVGLFVPLFTKKRQGLHDFATETVVVDAN